MTELNAIYNSKSAFTGLQNRYDETRPQYPSEALQEIVSSINLVGCNVLDVGCGTGIFTYQLGDVFPDCYITGCDINLEMLRIASDKVDSRMEFVLGHAESLPFQDQQFELITVAQAIQWFNRNLFYSEVSRLLAPTGLLCLIENNRNWRESEFLEAYEMLLEQYSPKYSRDYRSFDYASELRATGEMDHVKTKSFNWNHQLTNESFLRMARSSTKMQAAVESSEGKVLECLVDLLKTYSESGKVEVQYEAVLVTARV